MKNGKIVMFDDKMVTKIVFDGICLLASERTDLFYARS